MFYVAILLHGICYDFFFMTGQLYTDQEAPPQLRSAAQGLITFLTYGLGMLMGSLIAGRAVDFTHTVGTTLVRNWQAFWLISALTALLILLLIAIFFRDGPKFNRRNLC